MPNSILLTPFQVHMQSTDDATRSCLHEILTALEPLSLGTEEVSTIQLVLAEVFNNIIEHAYPATQPDGPIITACEQKSDGLHFVVTDHGFEMPGGATPLGISPSLDVTTNDLPEGGFGWFLIKDLAKDVIYQRMDGANQLRLRISVGQSPVDC